MKTTIEKPENQIVAENILIAKFMGYEVINYQHGEYKPIYNGHKRFKTIGEQKELWQGLDLQFTGRFTEQVKYPFSSNWNYLMPIIHQIEKQGFVVQINGISCKVFRVLEEENTIVSWVCGDKSNKIGLTYKTVIEFIKWYNEQKTT